VTSPSLEAANPQRVSLEQVDGALKKLWSTSGPGGKPATRAQTMTLVALCETVDQARRATPALAAAASAHNARTILVTWSEATVADVTADVALHTSSKDPSRPAGESIRLQARGAARAWVPSAITRLLTPDLPVCVWWVGDLPDHEAIFDEVVRHADLAIFDSGDMDLRDLPRLSRLAERHDGRYALADFSWLRLRSFQELTARFFDFDQCAACLDRIERVTIRFAPRAADPEPLSTDAALFAGWLASRLGWTLEGWSTSAPGSTSRVARVKSGARTIELNFQTIARPGVRAGALLDVVIDAGTVSFSVDRPEEQPLVLCWSTSGEDMQIPAHCVRLEESLVRDEAKTLPDLLARPIRDRAFEEALRAAATLAAPIASAGRG
jgi:glucose-6-phosphate dehydrogenase assembly protein OpcA